MKNKVIEAITKILIIILLMILIIFSYYKLADIETKEPELIKQSCNLEIKEYNGRKVFIVSPQNSMKSGTKDYIKSDIKILYFHGGSYVAEVSEQHWEFIEKIVLDTGATVIVPDYPLTPKYTYKDVFDMVQPLYSEIIERVEPADLVVMGDSAGGGLALALMEKNGEDGIQMPSQTILISPWVDTRLTNEEIDEVQKRDTELNKEALKLAGVAYAGNNQTNNYLVNPIQGDLSKLENVTILTGTDDILNPDIHVLEEKAKLTNSDITIKEYEGAKHIWIINNKGDKNLIKQGYQDLLDYLLGKSY